MVAMTNEVIGLPRGRALTRDDLDTMPDDGHRYELIDGVLIVSPAPRMIHQRALRELLYVLQAACPPGLEIFFAPFDVALSDDTAIQPDLLIARREDFTERDLPTAPLLAVEVLSPSTRAYDLLLKKDRLQRARCPHYWVVDPDIPAITTWTLENDVYVDTGNAAGAESLQLTAPFAVTITPADLVNP